MGKIKHVLSTSGGKDSGASYLLALESGVDFLPVFADTGNEHELTYEYVENFHIKTGGPKIQWVKADFSRQIKIRRDNLINGLRSKGWDDNRRQNTVKKLQLSGNPFLDLCQLKGRFPSTKAAFCSQELKHKPIHFQIIEPLIEQGYHIKSWQGVRALESLNRSCLPMREPDTNFPTDIEIYRPVIGWTAKEIFDLHKRHGIKPNPLYKLGCGRVGCMPCINSRKDELKNICERFPDHIEKIKRWENIVSEVSKRGISTFFAANKSPGEGDTRSKIENIIKWARTARGGRQYALPEPLKQCSSLYGLCE